jgi:glycerate dehydrogenase
MKAVFLDRASLDAPLRRPSFACDWVEHAATAPADVVARLTGAAIAVTNKVRLDDAALAALPGLRMIAVAATGTDIIDLAACRRRGIVVSNIRSYAGATVPEHTFALILALRRQLMQYHVDVRTGKWQAASQFCLLDHPIGDLAGSILGIAGYGALGRAVAQLGRAFGMSVLALESDGPKAAGVDYVSLQGMLAAADVISLHLPLGEATRNMIGAPELRRMKRGALLINTARGGLVDEAALATALREGWIGGAGFDVLTSEPPRTDNPLLAPDLPNFILTPHVAWASQQAMRLLADQLIDNIDAFARGSPCNVLT